MSIPFKDALKFWMKLGVISFGGPAGQIAIMHQELAEHRGWISEGQFLRALNFCMLLPGPEAQQLATYIGWRMHGILGGIIAGALFVIPSIFVMLLLSYLAVAHIDVPMVAAAFWGIQPVVVAIVISAVFRMGKKTLRHGMLYWFASIAFAAIFFFKISFPYIVVLAALFGLLFRGRFPQVFCTGEFDTELKECRVEDDPDINPYSKKASMFHLLRVLITCLFLWIIAVGSVWFLFGYHSTLSKIALFFSKAAFITFGGAYAVLSYITDMAVSNGWLTTEQMLIGLGFAESTPGPLIMVTQFVGFLGAWNLPDGLTPLTAGILGSIIATYVTFLPCFLFIFAGAPFIEAMAGNDFIQAALTGVTAAVVGVILNLAVWFGFKIILPDSSSPDFFALIMAAASLFFLQRYQVPIHYIVPVGAATGIVWKLLIM